MMSVPGRLVVLVVVLGLTAAGCSSHRTDTPAVSSAPSRTAPPPVDNRAPQQIVIAGFPTGTSPIYHYSIKSPGSSESGVIDAPDKIAELTLSPQHYTNPSYTEVVIYLLTKNRSWLKLEDTPADRSRFSQKWMSFNPKKLPYDDGTPYVYSGETAPRAAYIIFENSDDISRTSPGHFRGTVNLSQTDGFLTAAQLKALGRKAVSIPFTVVLDDQGRLTSTTMQIPAAGKFKASTFAITYDHYGTTAVPKLPTASEQTKAPAALYRLFN
jgi:hypothetical protein